MDKISEYGKIYSKISEGFTLEVIDNLKIYFKHPSIAEHFSIYLDYDFFISQGKKVGLLSVNEKIEEAINGGWWSHEKESRIKFLKKVIENLYKTRENLFYPSQQAEIDKQIYKNKAILITYTRERQEIIGYSLEDYANVKLTEELLINFTYKNIEFTEKLFDNKEEYYNLSEGQIEKIKKAFDLHCSMFNYEIIRKVAACPFFQNLVYLNDDAYSFWGKATSKCSKYQIDLILYGRMFRNIIKNQAESKKPIPDEIINDPDKFVSWVDNQSKLVGIKPINKKSKSSGSNYVTSPVGASTDDLKKLGIKVEKIKGKSLLELAEEKGGTLEKSDYFKARENS